MLTGLRALCSVWLCPIALFLSLFQLFVLSLGSVEGLELSPWWFLGLVLLVVLGVMFFVVSCLCLLVVLE